MELIKLAEHLHDLGLNVFPVIIQNDKKRPYFPLNKDPFKWTFVKEQRIHLDVLIESLNKIKATKEQVYLGILPGLIKEGMYKDNFLFALDIDDILNVDILGITQAKCKEKGIWYEKSLRKGIHVYGISKKSATWDKQHELGIELFPDDVYFITTYNNFENELYELIPCEDVSADYNQFVETLSKEKKIEVKKSKRIDVDIIRQGSKQGHRNQTAFDYARINRDKNNTYEETLAIMKEWNEKNSPPMDEDELIATIESAYSKKQIIRLNGELIDELRRKSSEYYEEDKNGHAKFFACPLANLIVYYNYDMELDFGENRGYLVINDKSNLILRYDDGVYRSDGENYIRGIIHTVLGRTHTKAKADEVINCIKADPQIKINERELKVDSRYVCLRNCIYDLQTHTTISFSPEFYFVNKLNVDYNPDAKCPKISKFFSEIVKPDDMQWLEEIFGWCLERHYLYQFIIFLFGSGNNGKTVYSKLLALFLGLENITAYSLKQLSDDSSAKACVHCKTANIGDDVGLSEFSDTDLLKQLTGDAPLMSRRLYENYEEPRFSYAKMVFNCNNLVRFPNDNSLGLYRRIKKINFPNTFDEKTANPNLLNELTTDEEMSGLLNLALDALERLHKNNKFTNAKDARDSAQDYTDSASPHIPYIRNNYYVTKDKNDVIEKDQIYLEYQDYCIEIGRIPVDKRPFFKDLYKTLVGTTEYRQEFRPGEDRPYCVRFIQRKILKQQVLD